MSEMQQTYEAIKTHGYELVRRADFFARAPAEHIERFKRDCDGNGEWVLWDPNDDEQGFMICAPTPEGCAVEWRNFFGEYIEA